MTKLVEEVFVTEGVPEYTFVTPPNFNEILVDIRRSGKPVIIEGQSGTGKTTAVKKIIDRIGIGDVVYLIARNPEDVSRIQRIVDDGTSGTFVIDDFHRLDKTLQGQLADIAKVAAESASYSSDTPKLVLIGINELGSDLIQMVPDIAKRMGIHRILPGTETDIRALVESGCELLNILPLNHQLIFDESRGDYWLTQQLCQTICKMGGVLETCQTGATPSRKVTLPFVGLRLHSRRRMQSWEEDHSSHPRKSATRCWRS